MSIKAENPSRGFRTANGSKDEPWKIMTSTTIPVSCGIVVLIVANDLSLKVSMGRHTRSPGNLTVRGCSVIEVVVVMEVTRRRSNVTRIAVTANMVEHPGYDPVLTLMNSRTIVPDFGLNAGVHPNAPDDGTECHVGELIGGEWRSSTSVLWLQHCTIVSHLGCECTTSFVLASVSSLPKFRCHALYLHLGIQRLGTWMLGIQTEPFEEIPLGRTFDSRCHCHCGF